jgi:hypothetical protein
MGDYSQVTLSNAILTAGRAEGTGHKAHQLATGEIDPAEIAKVPFTEGTIPWPVDMAFLQSKGAKLSMADATQYAARRILPPDCQIGYDIGAATMRYALTADQFAAIRDSLMTSCQKKGFDMAVFLHIGRVVTPMEVTHEEVSTDTGESTGKEASFGDEISDFQNIVQGSSDNIDVSTVNIDGIEQTLNDDFKNTVKKYLGDGAASLEDAVRRGVQTADKLLAVGEDFATGAALGAGIGSVVPILGTAIGGVVGSWIGGVYGAFDNFGGDIEKIAHDVFNPEDFTPGDYDRMRLRCIESGGLPVHGKAPDNEDGCVYPDGKTSGGDWPRHPAPGVQRVRGDSPWSVQHMPDGMIPDPNGNPMPRFVLKGPAPAKPNYLSMGTRKIDPKAVNAMMLAGMKAGTIAAPKPAPMPTIAPKKPSLASFKTPMKIMPAQMAGTLMTVGMVGANPAQQTPIAQSLASDPGTSEGLAIGIQNVQAARLTWWHRFLKIIHLE